MKCLGIDFGTTSVKAVLFDENLNEIATASEDYQVHCLCGLSSHQV
jgi:sugar (pentulose or hexulose) kinase